jgi:hypothetical protein
MCHSIDRMCSLYNSHRMCQQLQLPKDCIDRMCVCVCRVLGVLEEAFAGLDVYQKFVERLGEAQSIADMWARDEEVYKERPII